jgi:hypothetical protein
MTIDTLEYVKRLEAAGVDRKQAEAHAAAVRDTLATQLATKADIDALKQATTADIERLDHKFEAMMWKHTAGIIVTVIVTQLALAGALLRFLR